MFEKIIDQRIVELNEIIEKRNYKYLSKKPWIGNDNKILIGRAMLTLITLETNLQLKKEIVYARSR